MSPRLRKVRRGMELAGLPPDRLLRHGAPRIVYGVALAEQFREVLMGRRKNRARYFFPFDEPKAVTSQIADGWIKRRLCNRIEREDVIEEALANTLVYPVTHGARVELPAMNEEEPLFSELVGVS